LADTGIPDLRYMGCRDTFERLKAFWYHTGGQPVSPVAALVRDQAALAEL
jgi:hypothetical protein